jgi:hypothetical protein
MARKQKSTVEFENERFFGESSNTVSRVGREGVVIFFRGCTCEVKQYVF